MKYFWVLLQLCFCLFLTLNSSERSSLAFAISSYGWDRFIHHYIKTPLSLCSSQQVPAEVLFSLWAGVPPSSRNSVNRKDFLNSNKRQEPPKTPTTPKITTFPPAPVTCDAVRNKCREMLTTALQADDDYIAIGADCEHIAAQIEECIYQDIKNTDMKYKNRVRSRISNLKDSKNPELKKNVLCGAITPEQIAVMTSEEMASNELKEIRKAMTKEAIREHQMAKTGGTQTDLFTCGKCKKKNCTYTQVQTRSSDEPMTTFVVCNECGNRWKFC
uniref:Transcription elongation factor n=1 Tax=Gallus gallus TaxID=9031 RepID=A0A8V0ZSP2_CHICK